MILLGKIYAGILQTVISQELESSGIENLLKRIAAIIMFIHHESDTISSPGRLPDVILLLGWNVFLPPLAQSYKFLLIKSISCFNVDHAAGYLIAVL